MSIDAGSSPAGGCGQGFQLVPYMCACMGGNWKTCLHVSAPDFLASLEALGVCLSLGSPGRIRFEAPTGVLTPELRQAIAERKGDLLALLGGHTESTVPMDRPTPTAPATLHAPLVPEAARDEPGPEATPVLAPATLPYLTPAGDLYIPFDAPPRFHWWLPGGQPLRTTLAELDAPTSAVARYVNVRPRLGELHEPAAEAPDITPNGRTPAAKA